MKITKLFGAVGAFTFALLSPRVSADSVIYCPKTYEGKIEIEAAIDEIVQFKCRNSHAVLRRQVISLPDSVPIVIGSEFVRGQCKISQIVEAGHKKDCLVAYYDRL